jgi:hypothetical protein
MIEFANECFLYEKDFIFALLLQIVIERGSWLSPDASSIRFEMEVAALETQKSKTIKSDDDENDFIFDKLL